MGLGLGERGHRAAEQRAQRLELRLLGQEGDVLAQGGGTLALTLTLTLPLTLTLAHPNPNPNPNLLGQQGAVLAQRGGSRAQGGGGRRVGEV